MFLEIPEKFPQKIRRANQFFSKQTQFPKKTNFCQKVSEIKQNTKNQSSHNSHNTNLLRVTSVPQFKQANYFQNYERVKDKLYRELDQIKAARTENKFNEFQQKLNKVQSESSHTQREDNRFQTNYLNDDLPDLQRLKKVKSQNQIKIKNNYLNVHAQNQFHNNHENLKWRKPTKKATTGNRFSSDQTPLKYSIIISNREQKFNI